MNYFHGVMATASNDKGGGEQLKCPVCENSYTGPRKLPECGHQCCEVCILVYVSKLRDDGDLQIGFPCPSCNIINPGPKDLKAAIAWIQSLERGVDRTPQKDSVKAQQTQKNACSSCEYLGRTSGAVKFCIECYESLCQPCVDGRHTHKLFQNHKLINIDHGEEKSREDQIFQLMCELVTCTKHSDKINAFFCNGHEELCCESCVDSIHKDCCDVVKANTYAEKEKIKTEVEQIKRSAENLCSYAKLMIELKSANAEDNKKQVKVIITKLKAIRLNVNKLFDNLEEASTRNANSFATKQISTACKDAQILNNLIGSSTLSANLLEKLMTNDSLGIQNIVVKKLKEQMKGYEEEILHMSETIKRIRFKLKQGDFLKNLLNLGNNNTDKLAMVTEKEVASALLPFHSQLLLRQYKVRKVREVSTEDEDELKDIDPTYAIVQILRDNGIVVVDTDDSNYCILIKPNDEVLEPCDLATKLPSVDGERNENSPVRLAGNKEELVAIPFPSQNKILLISANESITVKRTIATNYKPRALHVLRNGDIAVAWYSPVAFGVISVGDCLVATKVYFQKDKSGRQLKSFDFITVDERRSHVIQPCSSNNAVYCFDFEGQTKFTYKVGSFSPRGVALDGDGNIYICSYDWRSSSIHVVCPSGSGLHVIGKADGCPTHPLAITFNKDGEEFAVTQEENSHVINVFRLHKETDSQGLETVVCMHT